MNKEEFCKEYNITERQFVGEDKIEGDLYLDGLTSIPKGFNPTIGGDLYLTRLKSIPEGFNPTVGGHLNLRSLTSIPQGFNPTVGWSLGLESLTSIPEGFNPTVGGHLDLNGLTSILEGFNPTVGWNLSLCGLTSIPDGFNPTVGNGLYLNGLTSIPEGFNPTVGGDLWLSGLTSIPEGFNPTVGDTLYLNSLTSIPDGFNPTVGWSLYVGGLDCDYTKLGGNPITWGDKYIKVDDIFTEVVSKRGNVYRVKKLNTDKVFYLVTDGNGKWAHGDTLKEAREDLVYKLNKDIDKSVYEGMTLDTKLSFEEAVVCYRVITGACSFGVKDFVSKNKIKKKKYAISEVIELTKGSYGSKEFENYFNK